MGAQTFTTSGSWQAPEGVTQVTVECIGGGGGGGGVSGNPAAGGGGAGGAYAVKVVSVTPGNSYTVTVGTGGAAGSSAGANGGAGNPSWFSTSGTVYAEGGAPGTGSTANNFNGTGGTGSSGSSIGDTVRRGGNGGAGASTGSSGGGGGGAGATAAGGDTTNQTAGTGNSPGGDGAAGTASGAGATGNTYGGGGSGGRAANNTNRAGGAGGAGAVFLSWSANLSATVSETVATTTNEAPAWSGDGAVSETTSTTTAESNDLEQSAAAAEAVAATSAESSTWSGDGAVSESAAVTDAASGSSPAATGVVPVYVPPARATANPASGPVRVNRSNPISRGLGFLFLGGHQNEIVNGLRPIAVSGSNQRVATAVGQSIDGSYLTYNLPYAGFCSGEMTVVARVLGTSEATYQGMCKVYNGSGSGNEAFWAFRKYAADQRVQISWHTGAKVAQYLYATNGFFPTSGFVTFAAARINSGANQFMRLYRDGKFFEDTGTKPAHDSPNSNRIQVGASGGTAKNISFVGIWDRALSPAELASISLNPHQVVEPQGRQFWFGSAAAPGVVPVYAPAARTVTKRQPAARVSVDLSNPITRKLVFAAIPAPAHANNARDLLSGLPGVAYRAVNLIEGADSRGAFYGSAVSGGASGVVYPKQPHTAPADGKLTVLAHCFPVSNGGGTLVSRAVEQSTVDYSDFAFGRGSFTDQTYDWVFETRKNGTLLKSIASTLPAISNGNEYVAGVRVDGDQVWFFANGKIDSAQTHGESLASIVAGQSVPLQHFAAASRARTGIQTEASFVGRVYFAAVWLRALSDAELLSVMSNPYSILRGSAPVPYWFGSAGGSTTHNATAAESVGTSSAQSANQDTTGTVAETAAIVDARSATWTGDAAVSIALSVTTAEAGALAADATVAETVATTSSQAQDGAAVLTVGESIGATADASLVASWAVLASFQLAATDTDAAVATFEATATETVAATSSQAQDGAVVMTVSESVGTATSEAATWSGSLTVTESVAGQSLEAVAAQFVAAVAETVAQVSAQAAGATIDGAVAETIGTTSPVAVSLTLTGDVAFDLGVFDLVGATSNTSAAVVFNAALAEQVAAAIAYQVGAVESVAIVEQVDQSTFAAIVGLPDGRTLTVRVEARTRVVDVEARAFTVRAEQRRATVEQENRTVEVSAESRTFTIH